MKTHLIIGIMLVSSLSGQPEPLQLEWFHEFGSESRASWDVLTAATMDSEGNTYITGTGMGYTHTKDVFTLKIDNSGSIVWENYRELFNDSSDESFAIHVDNSGSVYVGISAFRHSIVLPQVPPQTCIIKYNAAGTESWVYTFPHNSHSHVMTGDAAGYIYVAYHDDNEGALLIKIGTDGTLQWNQDLSTPTHHIHMGGDGFIYLTGSNDSNHATYHKLDSDGVSHGFVTWEQNIHNIKIKVDASGNVVLMGNMGSGGNQDVALTMFDASGWQFWENTYDGALHAEDTGIDLDISPQGNIYALAKSSEEGDWQDLTILVYDPMGNTLWTHIYDNGDFNADRPMDMKVDATGNVFFSGYAFEGWDNRYFAAKLGHNGALQWSFQGEAYWEGGQDYLLLNPQNHVQLIHHRFEAFDAGEVNVVATTLSDSGYEIWSSSHDGPRGGLDLALDLKEDGWGNLYVLSLGSTPSGMGGFRIQKLLSNGVLSWTSVYDTLGSPGSALIHVDPNGEVFFAASFSEVGDDLENAIVVMLVDPLGNVVWNQTTMNQDEWCSLHPIINQDEATFQFIQKTPFSTEIKQYAPDGNLILDINLAIDGQPSSYVRDDSGYIYISGFQTDWSNYSRSMLTEKYAPDGEFLWSQTYIREGDSEAESRAFAVDDSGNVFVTGFSWNDATGSAIVTMKYDRNGNEIWMTTHSDPSSENNLPADMVIDPEGDLIILGQSGSGEISDILLMKIDRSGNQVWTQLTEGIYGFDNGPAQVRCDTSGTIHFSGASFSTLGYPNSFITSYTSTGEAVNTQVVGIANEWNHPVDLSVDEAGEVIILGNTLYDPDESWGMLSKLFVAKYSQNMMTGLSLLQQNPNSPILQQNYPNPFNPSTTIRYGLPEEANVSLVIYDVRGQVVQSLESGHQSAGWYDVIWNGETVDGKSISTGIYFARLVAGDYSQVIKMLYLK